MVILKNIKLTHIIIAALLVIIVWLKACDSTNIKHIEPNIKDTVTTVDTIEKNTSKDTQYVPYPVYVEKPVNIPSKVDTQAILIDYYSKYFYKDTIFNLDSSAQVVIADTISENKIQNRIVDIKSNQKTIIITNNITEKVKEDPKMKFYGGFTIGVDKQFFNYFGPDLYIIPKNDKHLYGIGVGLNNNIQPTLQFKAAWKIGKK